MTKRHPLVLRVLALTSVLSVSATLPGPAWASERAPTTPTQSLRASVDGIAVSESHRLDKTPVAAKARDRQAGQTTDARLESGSFFKRPIGIAVLAAFGIGAGYALYSASNDRIRSSGR